MGITWTRSPSQVASDIRTRASHVPDAAFDEAQRAAIDIRDTMQANRPWNDRTTNARTHLEAEAVHEGKNVHIVAYHQMDYGPYLELGTSRMKAYPIIEPTLRMYGPDVIEGVAIVVFGLLSEG